MKIGIDADGVLTDMSAFNFVYGEKFFGHKPANPAGYKTREIFGETKQREFLFGLRYFYDYCINLKPRGEAPEVCKALQKDGHILYAITARKFSTEKSPLGALSRKLFKKWLQKNGFSFEDIFFCTEKNTPREKLEYCKKLSVNIMIDDNPEVALFLAENGVRVLLFDAPYNQNVIHPDITRVLDWKEIYDILNTHNS